MRKILFKAKTINTQIWVQGYFFAKPILERYFIICDEVQWEIDPNTLCQYTGMTDKNGNMVWENDLVEVKSNKRHFISEIYWDDCCTGFMFQDTETTFCGMDALSDGGCYRFNYEVVGNVFDNADLVKG